MSTSANLAFLILRLVGGLTLAAHGAQKLFGWFDGPGPAKLTQGFRAQGFRPARLWVGLVILGELGGGLSFALGLLTPLGAAGGFGAMCMAIAKTHWKNGFWNSKRGYEFPLALLAIAVAVASVWRGPAPTPWIRSSGWRSRRRGCSACSPSPRYWWISSAS